MDKNYYCIRGPFSFRYSNNQMLIEKKFTEQERHLQAHSRDQAVFLFAKRFSKKLEREVYIGNAVVFKVKPPRKVREKKKFKQLKLF